VTVCGESAHPVEPSVARFLDEEKQKGVNSPAYYKNFAAHVQELKSSLVSLVAKLRAEGKTIAMFHVTC